MNRRTLPRNPRNANKDYTPVNVEDVPSPDEDDTQLNGFGVNESQRSAQLNPRPSRRQESRSAQPSLTEPTQCQYNTECLSQSPTSSSGGIPNLDGKPSLPFETNVEHIEMTVSSGLNKVRKHLHRIIASAFHVRFLSNLRHRK